MTGPTDPTEVNPPQWAAPPAAVSPTGAASESAAPWPVNEAAPAPAAAVRRTAWRRGPLDIVLVVAALFAFGGISFAVGRVTAPATAGASGGGRFQAGAGQLPGGQGPGVFGAGGVTISGEVVSVTATELSLKLASGQTIQIPLDSSTMYHSQAPATAADVTTGATVQVQVGRGIGGRPNASPGTGGSGGGTTGGGRFELGPATSVTVVPR
jgi:RNase P/RNase MRP subunit p29